MASKTLDEETSKKVIRQVEFYFSDSNLPRDNFLKNTISESDDGMVSLALICSFTRMRNHLDLGDAKADDVTEDTVKAVADTLRTSESLKISEDGKKVGRSTELPKPDELIEQLDVRTVAASPFRYNVNREDVEAFFAKFAEVTSVRLPRHVGDKRVFGGSALVEFSSEEDAEKILKQSFDYEGVKLELKPKKDFDAEREKEAQEFENVHSKGKNNSSSEVYYTKGVIVAFTLKKASNEGSEEENGAGKPASESANGGDLGSLEKASNEGSEEENGAGKPASESTNGGDLGSLENVTEDKDEETPAKNTENKSDLESDGKETQEGEKPLEEEPVAENEKTEDKPSAASYRNNKDVVLREDLKKVFQRFGAVKYIDFNMGAESGYVRFELPEAAQKARAAAVLAEQGGLEVKNFITTLEPVTGDAEKDYWVQLLGGQEKFRDSKGGNRGRGGRHNNNRGRKHGRSRDNDSSYGRPTKAQKV